MYKQYNVLCIEARMCSILSLVRSKTHIIHSTITTWQFIIDFEKAYILKQTRPIFSLAPFRSFS